MGGSLIGYPGFRCWMAVLLIAGFLPGCGPDAPETLPRHEPSQVLADNQARIVSSLNRCGPSVRIRSSLPWRIAFLMKNFAWASPYWRRAHEGAESASSQALQAIRAGRLHATIAQAPPSSTVKSVSY